MELEVIIAIINTKTKINTKQQVASASLAGSTQSII